LTWTLKAMLVKEAGEREGVTGSEQAKLEF
jgi:hypothetical protein